MNNRKIIADLAVDRYFVESKNPLLRQCLRFLGKPATKKEMKEELLK